MAQRSSRPSIEGSLYRQGQLAPPVSFRPHSAQEIRERAEAYRLLFQLSGVVVEASGSWEDTRGDEVYLGSSWARVKVGRRHLTLDASAGSEIGGLKLRLVDVAGEPRAVVLTPLGVKALGG